MPGRNDIPQITVFTAILCLYAGLPVFGQVEILAPLHLSHVRGIVTDMKGKPIAEAEVRLMRNDKVALEARTDASGKFTLDHASGRYLLRVQESHSSMAAREVVIGTDLAALFHKDDLYVMLESAACMDACSKVFSTKRQFDRAVRWNTGHYD